jgi:hypothetical protein
LVQTTSNRRQLLNLLTDQKLGFNVFSYLKDLQNTNNTEILLLADLLYNSLASLAIKNLNRDCFVTLSLIGKVESIESKESLQIGINEAMNYIEKSAKKYEFKIPKIVSDYKKGTLGFVAHTANREITIREIKGLTKFIEEILPNYIIRSK